MSRRAEPDRALARPPCEHNVSRRKSGKIFRAETSLGSGRAESLPRTTFCRGFATDYPVHSGFANTRGSQCELCEHKKGAPRTGALIVWFAYSAGVADSNSSCPVNAGAIAG